MPRRLIASLAAVALTLGARLQAADELAKREAPDCGTFALYHMLRLEGRPTSLDRLTSMLGPPGPEGHSFRDLREAARRCGTKLDAVVLPKKRSAISGPALLFVKTQPEGHFVVVRPVGHTGRLIQWIDGDRTPVVLDADWLFASPSWTGLALVPRRTNPVTFAAAGASLVFAVVFAALRCKLRQARSGSRAGRQGTDLTRN